jgi:hypothetical protein
MAGNVLAVNRDRHRRAELSAPKRLIQEEQKT